MKFFICFLLWAGVAGVGLSAEIEYIHITVPENDRDFNSFKERYLVVDGDASLRKGLNDGEIKYETVFKVRVDSGTVSTNTLFQGVPYLKESSSGLYEIKKDVYEGREIISSYRYDGALLFLSLKSVVHEAKRTAFGEVPEWNIGVPEEKVWNEIDFQEMLIVKGWNILRCSTVNGLTVIEAIRVIDNGAGAGEYNKGAKIEWHPLK
jgi:hypothetical protein